MTLEKKYELAKELLSHPRLNEFREAGFINFFSLRNCRIIDDYNELRKSLNHIDCLETLSQKYFLSKERILSILYK